MKKQGGAAGGIGVETVNIKGRFHKWRRDEAGYDPDGEEWINRDESDPVDVDFPDGKDETDEEDST